MILKHAFLILFLCFFCGGPRCAAENIITVDAGHELGPVNRAVFGVNLIAYDPKTYENMTSEYYGYSDYGAGIWDPQWNKPVASVLDLARSAGVKTLRFPGGCGVHHYDWKRSIGKERQQFLFGLDEFLFVAKKLEAEPVITVSYFTGNEHDAADLVEYLKALNDGAHPWAAKRALNGHPEPYHVRYFEIGNEVWHGDHRKIQNVSPRDYAKRYLDYYDAMKAVDPSAQIGLVLDRMDWNKEVIACIGSKVDFAILHLYPTPAWDDSISGYTVQNIYEIAFGKISLEYEPLIRETVALLRAATGRTIPLAITEFNGGLPQEKPVPFRHALGTALINAELLRVFMLPENHVAMAQYWQFNNSFWGMVENKFYDDPTELARPYFKRPNYLVYKLYADHFGDKLVNVSVKGDSFDVGGYDHFHAGVTGVLSEMVGLRNTRIPHLSVNASVSSDGNKLFLVIINKNLTEKTTAVFDLKNFIPTPEGIAFILNGPAVDATNENDHEKITIKQLKLTNITTHYSLFLEPHSVTAIEFERKRPTNQP